MPWSGWQPCLPVRAAPVCVQRTGRRRQVHSCPLQRRASRTRGSRWLVTMDIKAMSAGESRKKTRVNGYSLFRKRPDHQKNARKTGQG